jgi:hypothetical protein
MREGRDLIIAVVIRTARDGPLHWREVSVDEVENT